MRQGRGCGYQAFQAPQTQQRRLSNKDIFVSARFFKILGNSTEYTVVNGYSSSYCPTTSEIPRGSDFAVYFVIYVNGLPNNVTSKINLFSGARVMYRFTGTKVSVFPYDHSLFQDDIEHLSD